MKKPLLLVSATAMMAGTMLAAPQQTVTFSKSSAMAPKTTSFKAPAKAEGEDPFIVYTKAEEVKTAYSLNNVPNNSIVYMAFEMSVDDQAPFIGNKISAINVMAGAPASGNGAFPISKVQTFVTDNLAELPTNKTAGTISTEPYSVTSIPMSEPYTITGEKPIYIGYFFRLTASYYMVCDQVPTSPSEKNMLVAVASRTTDVPQYMNYSDQEPGSLCLSCNISGESLPVNIAQAKEISLPGYVEPGTSFSYDLVVKNVASNEITSLTVRSEYGDKTIDSDITLTDALDPSATGTVKVENLPLEKAGVYKLAASVVKVNGVEVAHPTSVSGSFTSFTGGLDRRAVIEEGTGTWCGYCPRGIVMLEYIAEKYPDFIRIVAHNGDAMQCNEYAYMLNDYMPGFPGAVVNREFDTELGYGYSVQQLHEVADNAYQYITKDKTYCDVNLTGECASGFKKAYIHATANFAIDVTVEHQLSFVVVEDGVGPYKQNNNYSGGKMGPMNGWEKESNSVSTIYNDVARSLKGYPGIPGSLPASLSAGSYNYDVEVDISKVKGKDFRVIAMIVNTQTGVIVNANEISINKDTAVEGVLDDADNIEINVDNGNVVVNGANSVAVYTLDGRQMGTTGLSNGVYIVKADNVTRKIFVK